jgi:hypothetical protein
LELIEENKDIFSELTQEAYEKQLHLPEQG